MKISNELLDQICFGKVCAEYTENGVIFHRTSENTTRGFYTIDTDFGQKCSSSTCINFEFFTDSKNLYFEYCNVTKGSSRLFYYFDVCVNDALVLHHGHENRNEISQGSFNLTLDGNLNKITIYSPNLVSYTLKQICVDDEAKIIPVVKPYKILMLGDSITHGYDTKYPMNSYANTFGRILNAEIVNQAIGGARADAVALDGGINPDYITVAYGTNDWGHKTRQDFEHDYDEYVKTLTQLYPSVPVFLLSPIYRRDENTIKKSGDFSVPYTIVKSTAQKYGCTFFDAHSFVPHLDDYFMPDGIHPNELGHIHYGIAFASVLKEFIK